MIDLSPQHLDVVRAIAAASFPGAEVRVFGSRARGTARPFSDLDLAVRAAAPLPVSVLEAAKDAFSVSSLPFSVDVVDYHAVSPAFRAAIDAHALPLP